MAELQVANPVGAVVPGAPPTSGGHPVGQLACSHRGVGLEAIVEKASEQEVVHNHCDGHGREGLAIAGHHGADPPGIRGVQHAAGYAQQPAALAGQVIHAAGRPAADCEEHGGTANAAMSKKSSSHCEA